jgi:ABC-type cobalamin/Fe3+-siderophores transport system ATPase subunit
MDKDLVAPVIRLELTSPFKSIVELAKISFPKFVILTGENGAGKTQLLQAIQQKKAVLYVDDVAATDTKMLSSGLGELGSKTFYGNKLEMFAIELQNKLSSFSSWKNLSGSKVSYESFFSKDEQQILERVRLARKDQPAELPYADRLEIMKGMPPGFIVKDKSESIQKFDDVFQLDLSQLFKRYQIVREKNDFSNFLKETKGRAEVEALTDAEFIVQHGDAPWILANQILRSAGLGYSLTTPESQGAEDPFTAKLINDVSGIEIPFVDLSSGEKVLMSLALALYRSELDHPYPSVLLFDEPDCHLHPSMAGKLLKVIQEVFVTQRGITVVMTTHSPSTVALAPDNCLFVMSKTGGRISKQSKDRCIKVLTTGVPALSVEYDNRVQVFVESKHDAKNYGDAYEALKRFGDSEISLNFISSGAGGSGSSEQVREIVSTLRRNGNSKVYGIVDWDNRNEGNEFVKVACYKTRYSLESLIFDPLLLALYLLRESVVSSSEFGIAEAISYVKVGALQQADYQKLASYVTKKIKGRMSGIDGTDFADISYICGVQISVENWYLKANGHSLEEAIKQAFPSLKRFRKENDLKNEVIKKVLVDYPELAPIEFMKLFSSIQSQHVSG